MSNLKRFIVIILLFIFIFTFYVFTAKTFATDINMNLANESTISDNGNSRNNSTPTLDTNTVTNIESIDEYNESTSSFDFSDILNILLLTVGLVIILLAVAILIRLGK